MTRIDNKDEVIKVKGEIISKLRSLLAQANRRLEPLIQYYELETDLEDTIDLDDGALASAWREQYYELLSLLDKTGNR